MKPLFLANDNVIEIDDPPLTDTTDDSAVVSGTLSFVLKKTSDGSQITTGTLSHVSGGVWRGEIPKTVSLVAGTRYTLEVTADSSGRDGFWSIDCIGRVRKG